MRGKISQWKDEKGFGFITSDDNEEKIFFHISAIKTQGRRPKVNDVVLYEITHDSQGRAKAKAVAIEGVATKPKKYNKKRIHTEPPKKDAIDYVSILLIILSLAGAAYSFNQSNSIEKLITAGIIFVVAVVMINRQKKPKEKIFSCARCRKISEHDKRTISAWNRGLLKLYCNSCHQKWLEDQPKQQHVALSTQGRGCLGVSALLALLQILIGVAGYQWLTRYFT
jgi:cold shock CspA family protein